MARRNKPESLDREAIARLKKAGVASFALAIGREYTVFGMTLTKDGLFVLILAGEVRARPSLVSIELFEVSDPALSKDWLFLHKHEDGSDIHAMWGYFELVQGEMGFDGLFSEKRVSAHEAFAVAARLEDISDRERAELEALEAYVKRRAVPQPPPTESPD